MTRTETLDRAKEIVNGERDEQYGNPEDNFHVIAEFWTTYLEAKGQYVTKDMTADDVANMMILLKVARNASGNSKDDNWVDIAGYAACGAETISNK